jgi:BirA family biotin operon repressor/biotin-[acetyl-CoA-carboxylase] ligase
LIDASGSELPPARWPLVSLAAALAIKDVLVALLPNEHVRLKWPNDVYVSERKICGILVESPPARPARLVIGIGLNVNNSFAGAPAEVQARATSLSEQAGETFDREAVLGEVVARLLGELADLGSKTAGFADRWAPFCLLTGKVVWIDVGDREVAGRCAGIDASGALLVETQAGRERLFAGVVKRWE